MSKMHFWGFFWDGTVIAQTYRGNYVKKGCSLSKHGITSEGDKEPVKSGVGIKAGELFGRTYKITNKFFQTRFLLSPRTRGNSPRTPEVLVSVMHKGNFCLSFINTLQGLSYALLPGHPFYQAESWRHLISVPEEWLGKKKTKIFVHTCKDTLSVAAGVQLIQNWPVCFT